MSRDEESIVGQWWESESCTWYNLCFKDDEEEVTQRDRMGKRKKKKGKGERERRKRGSRRKKERSGRDVIF